MKGRWPSAELAACDHEEGRQFGALDVYMVISTGYGNGLQEMMASCHS